MQQQRTNRLSILHIIEIAYVVGLLVYTSIPLIQALSLPWYRNSDEVVFAAEVIRFLRLDFRQRFFDIPGTPYMVLCTLSWLVWYVLNLIAGRVSPDVSPSIYALENIQDLYTLMRGWVIVFYLVSIVLIYLLARRFTSPAGGAFAALFAALFSVYSPYSSFVRTESMGVFLALVAVFLALHAIKTGRLRYYWFVGLLCGISMAVRYQFIFATLPVVVVLHLLKGKRPQQEQIPAWAPLLVMLAAVASIAGALITLGHHFGIFPTGELTDLMLITNGEFTDTRPVAHASIQRVWLLLGALAVVVMLIWWIPALRKRLKFLFLPPVVAMVMGSGLGLFLGLPTFVWSRQHLLASIQFYGTWYEIPRMGLSPLAQFVDSVGYYAEISAPTLVIALLYAAGAILILVKRDRFGIAVLLGCILGVLMHPPAMKSFPHHIIPWTAYFAVLAAYPFSILYRRTAPITMRAAALAVGVAAAVAILAAIPQSATWGQGDTTTEALRLETVQQATDWMEDNLDGSNVYVAYNAFNQFTMYRWLGMLDIAIPESVQGSNSYLIWWANRTSLQNDKGYVLVSPEDIAAPQADNEMLGEYIDPFADSAFEPVRTFPYANTNFTLFRFDLIESQ